MTVSVAGAITGWAIYRGHLAVIRTWQIALTSHGFTCGMLRKQARTFSRQKAEGFLIRGIFSSIFCWSWFRAESPIRIDIHGYYHSFFHRMMSSHITLSPTRIDHCAQLVVCTFILFLDVQMVQSTATLVCPFLNTTMASNTLEKQGPVNVLESVPIILTPTKWDHGIDIGRVAFHYT